MQLDTLYIHLTLYTPRYTLCTTPKGPGAVVARHDWRERRHQRPVNDAARVLRWLSPSQLVRGSGRPQVLLAAAAFGKSCKLSNKIVCHVVRFAYNDISHLVCFVCTVCVQNLIQVCCIRISPF